MGVVCMGGGVLMIWPGNLKSVRTIDLHEVDQFLHVVKTILVCNAEKLLTHITDTPNTQIQ